MGKAHSSSAKLMRVKVWMDRNGKCEKCNRNVKIRFDQYYYIGRIKPGVIHHKNGNPDYNVKANLMLLCLSCHQAVHKEMKNGSRTIRQD